MLYIPPLGYREVQNNLPATPTVNVGPVGATASASIHTKGSWTQLVASTNYESEWMVIVLASTSAGNTVTDTLVDIGVGGAGSEQVLIPDLLAGWASNAAFGPRTICLPIYVPKGTRIAARAQSAVASKSVSIAVFLYGGARNPSMPTFSAVDAIGVDSATSRGTSITAGNSGAEGAWTSVGSSTSRPYKALMFLAQGTQADTTMAGVYYHFEVGYSSTTLAEFHIATVTDEHLVGPLPPLPIFHPIPSGTQLQVRGECSGTADPIDVSLYGLY